MASVAVLALVGLGIGLAERAGGVAVPLTDDGERRAARQALTSVEAFTWLTPRMVFTPGERVVGLTAAPELECPGTTDGSTESDIEPGAAPTAYVAHVQMLTWFGLPTARHVEVSCTGIHPVPAPGPAA